MTNAGRETDRFAFLDRTGWGWAARQPLARDVSARRHVGLPDDGRQAILMAAPPGCSDDIGDFLQIAANLRVPDLPPLVMFAADETQDFAVIGDLVDNLFAGAILACPELELSPYLAAGVLLHIQENPPSPALPSLTAGEWARFALDTAEHHVTAITGRIVSGAEFVRALSRALRMQADGKRVC